MMNGFTTNTHVLGFVDQAVNMCKPQKTVWIDGSEQLYDQLLKEALDVYRCLCVFHACLNRCRCLVESCLYVAKKLFHDFSSPVF